MSNDTSNASVERLRREVRPSMPDDVLRLWATDAVTVLGALLAERDAARADAARLREALDGLLPTALHYGGLRDCDAEAIKAARAALAGGKDE